MEWRRVAIYLTAGLAFVALVLFATHYFMSLSFEPAKSGGEYGDRFGVADAIFSGLALTAAFVTLWLQGQEIRSTLQDHREAVELQALASLSDAVRNAVDRGDARTYDFQGKEYGPAELQSVLLEKLIADFDKIATDQRRRKRKK